MLPSRSRPQSASSRPGSAASHRSNPSVHGLIAGTGSVIVASISARSGVSLACSPQPTPTAHRQQEVEESTTESVAGSSTIAPSLDMKLAAYGKHVALSFFFCLSLSLSLSTCVSVLSMSPQYSLCSV